MKLPHSLLIILLALSSSVFSQNVDFSFVFDGKLRDCRLYIPAMYDGSYDAPLIINIHGFGGSGPGQQDYSKMDVVADTAGFLVAYPTGYINTWNAGAAYYAGLADEDDVAYISALIDTIGSNYRVDPSRVYATGMSNGGDMSYRLGCELDNKIAAIGPVTGTMISDIFASCTPTKPMPLIHMHGTADAISNIDGGPGWESLRDALILWAGLGGCSAPTSTLLPDLDPTDGTRMRLFESTCSNGADINLFLNPNGGHTWPGSDADFFTFLFFGYTNQDIDGSSELWNFFRNYSRPDAPPFPRGGRQFKLNSLRLFPQPASQQLQLLGNFSDGLVRLQIHDLQGRVVLSGELNFVAGQSSSQLDISELSAGQYLIHAHNGSQSQTSKLLIAR
jgi:polyhydroxybutyrate depolymerase